VDDKSIPLFQDFTEDHPPGGHNVYPFPPVVAAMSRICSTNAVSTSVMRRCGPGGTGSDRCLQPKSERSDQLLCAVCLNGDGIWTRFSSGSTVKRTISDEPLITKEKFLRRLSQRSEIVPPPLPSGGSCPPRGLFHLQERKSILYVLRNMEYIGGHYD
jgi:hypothetical protein